MHHLQGKWLYEVTLGTGGIMQLGWATHACQFSNEEGVGDSPDSYAFDGKRVRKWNIRSAQPLFHLCIAVRAQITE